MAQISMGGAFRLHIPTANIFDISGELSGQINSSGDLLLTGEVTNAGTFPMPDANASVSNESVTIETSFLGAYLSLELANEDILTLRGTTSYSFSPSITIIPPDISAPAPFGNIHIPAFLIEVDFFVSMTITLSTVPSFEIVASFNGKQINFSTNQIFAGLDDLVDEIVNRINDNPLDYFCEAIRDRILNELYNLLNIENEALNGFQSQIDTAEDILEQHLDYFDDIPGVGYVIREGTGDIFDLVQEQLALLETLNSYVMTGLAKVADLNDLIDEWTDMCG